MPNSQQMQHSAKSFQNNDGDKLHRKSPGQ